jgi:hypothetical protein
VLLAEYSKSTAAQSIFEDVGILRGSHTLVMLTLTQNNYSIICKLRASAVPQLKCLFAARRRHEPDSNPGEFHVADKVALGLVHSDYYGFLCQFSCSSLTAGAADQLRPKFHSTLRTKCIMFQQMCMCTYACTYIYFQSCNIYFLQIHGPLGPLGLID